MTFRTTQSTLLLKLDTVILCRNPMPRRHVGDNQHTYNAFLFKVDVDPPLSGSST
jgi:hypothetical protein